MCFLHSTRIEPRWRKSFLNGLAGQGINGDPEVSSDNNVNVLFHEAGGNYKNKDTSNGNLHRAARNMISATGTTPKLFIATGGMVSALAANGNTSTVPILVIMGRSAAFTEGLSVGGYFIDDIPSANNNVTLNAKATNLRDKSYNKPFNTQWLIYNGNSNMAANEVSEWQAIVGANNQQIDASFGSDNGKLDLKQAIDNAVTAGAHAIVLSADPQFFTKAPRIVRYAKNHMGLVMCYPLQEYADEADDAGMSKTSDYMVYGPSLIKVYKKLGDLAGQFLSGTIASFSGPIKLVADDKDNPYYTGV